MVFRDREDFTTENDIKVFAIMKADRKWEVARGSGGGCDGRYGGGAGLY
jgi:hypothetical protein